MSAVESVIEPPDPQSQASILLKGLIMKSNKAIQGGLMLLAAVSLTPLSMGQAVTTEIVKPESAAVTTTTGATKLTGTISEYSPTGIVLAAEGGAAPLRYSFSKTTTYVDETGAVVAPELIKVGMPVTVQYSRTGDQLIADRVIVQKASTTTTTTTPGTPA